MMRRLDSCCAAAVPLAPSGTETPLFSEPHGRESDRRTSTNGSGVVLTPNRLARFRDGILNARSMDELLDLERRLGPIDEDDPAAADLCYEIRTAACHLSRGPAPARETFTLVRAAPTRVRSSFRVRGRIGDRIATVTWADGRLYGSVYALARLEARPADDRDPARALDRIVGAFDSVTEAPTRAA